jgi:hypothetical protein
MRGDETDSNAGEERESTRAMTPDQVVLAAVGQRARSPTVTSTGPGSRAVSPTNGLIYPVEQQQAPNMMAAVNGIANAGVTGRSSPVVGDRKGSEPLVNPHAGSNTPSPTANGFRPGSRNGHVGHGHHGGSVGGGGSVSNVTADLIRDLKVKDMELEGAKRQINWMKEALGKATKAGFVYVGRSGSPLVEDRDEGQEEGGNKELLLKFKQFKAQMQVCAAIPVDIQHFLTRIPLGGHGRASQKGL